jgi:hypothetical protein
MGTAQGVIYDENDFSVGREGPLIPNSAQISLEFCLGPVSRDSHMKVSALVNRASRFPAIGNLATGRQTPASERYANAALLSSGCSQAYPSHFSPFRSLDSRSEFEVAESMYSHG